jgi:hypothetical protein
MALREAGEKEAPGVTGLTRRRIRKFLGDTTVALGAIGIFDPEPPSKKNGSRKTKAGNGSGNGKGKTVKVPPVVNGGNGKPTSGQVDQLTGSGTALDNTAPVEMLGEVG